MLARSLVLAIIGWFVCLSASPCLSAPVPPTKPPEDKRLSVKVSMSAPHIYLGQLLERLSAQTGVALSMDERDEESGIQVAVFLSQVPLRDVMNALWSLNSFRGAEWRWTRSGEPDKCSYRLEPPLDAKRLPERMRQRVQAAFEQQATMLLKAAKMTPEERKSFMADKDKATAAMLSDDRVIGGVSLFAEAFSPQMQLQILRGQAKPTVQVSQLSPETQDFLRSEWKLDGGSGSLPTSISFETQGPDEIVLSPSLFILINGSGNGYIGGMPLDAQLRSEFAQDWFLPGDASDDPVSSRLVALPDKTTPSRFENLSGDEIQKLSSEEREQWSDFQRHTAERRLRQLAEETPLSLMAVLPAQEDDHLGDPHGKTVAKYLSALRESGPSMMTKWRDRILLLRHSAWFLEDTNVSLKLIRQVRRALQQPDGLSFDDLAALADAVSEPQLRRLADDFPVLEVAIAIRGPLSLYHRFPEMMSVDGLPLRPDIIAFIKQMGSQLQDLQDNLPKAATIRFIEKNHSSNLSGHLISLSLLSNSGKPVYEQDFLFDGRPGK